MKSSLVFLSCADDEYEELSKEKLNPNSSGPAVEWHIANLGNKMEKNSTMSGVIS